MCVCAFAVTKDWYKQEIPVHKDIKPIKIRNQLPLRTKVDKQLSETTVKKQKIRNEQPIVPMLSANFSGGRYISRISASLRREIWLL